MFFELSRQGFLVGNRDLRPTTVNSLEFGLGYKKRNLRAGINYFTNHLRNNIIRSQAIGGAVINIPGLNVNGIEVEIQQHIGLNHFFFANYTFQNPETTGIFKVGPDPGIEVPAGSPLESVPSHLANLGATIGLGPYLSITPTLRLRGPRPRISLEVLSEVAGYSVLDLNFRLKNLLDTVEITGTVSNLLDKEYFDPAPVIGAFPGGYPRPGRNVCVRLNYRF